MGRLLLIVTALLCLPLAYSSGLEGVASLRQFSCKNGRNIQLMWKCDGEDDCNDNSDETDPECVSPLPCTADQFRCGNGRCISQKFKCDGEPDCPNGEDEDKELCKNVECAADMFQCEKFICIPLNWVCDRQIDCDNGLDEQNCNRHTCSNKEHTCGDGKCIETKWVCDGDRDCSDGSDELNCEEKKCDEGLDFTCKSDGHCIPLRWKCDGDSDCTDNSDEMECNKTQVTDLCLSNEFQCADKTTCIHTSWICDGSNDCPSGDDENKELCNSTCPVGQFQCADKSCISGDLHCNGVGDCPDQSDESDCQWTVPSCLAEEIDCGSGLCVSMSKACDGRKDCPNGEDEDKCNVNECLINNGGCEHLCIDNILGHSCECRNGYRLDGNSSCVDINECDTYGACSHNCYNEKGSYSCTCNEGYKTVPTDHRRCKAVHDGARLIYTERNTIVSSSLDGHQIETIVTKTNKAKALDFDYKSGFIFWSETTDDKANLIFRSHISSGTIKTPIITTKVNKTDNIAVDWIYDHIYWTDTGKKSIEVSNFEGTIRKIVIGTDLDEPRAIAVDAVEGWLFWSDWGETGKIERAELDGSNRKVLVLNSVKWPNGIALDLVKHRLYWVDAKLNGIYSINYDGSGRKEVKHSTDSLHHPYSLTLFEDRIFWTDWDSQGIFRADKFDGSNMTNIMPQFKRHNPMVVHIHHPYRQPRSENHCLDAGCSHFCFPRPRMHLENSKFSCACPDELQLAPDKKTCRETVIPTSESTPVTMKTPKTLPPIVIDFEPNMETTRKMDYALLIFLFACGISFIILFVAFVSLVLYKLYLNGNIKIMNFDNPLYKKAATRDPYTAYNIEAQLSYPSTPNEEAHQPLTSTLTMESTVYQ